tara:strand:+ start:9250 stop:11736 length:2487 start_codon:yes stop_codon:yes gene_type:complete
MAKQTQNNNIKIHFRAEGEQELKNAIRALARATKDLKNSQVNLAKATGATTKVQKDSIRTGILAHRNQRNMNAAVREGNMTFSVFRSKLLLASFAVGLMAGTVGRLVAAFAEQESSEKRIDAALKSTKNISLLTANEIKKMSSNLQDVGVIGDEVNNKMAALLLTFTNIRGQAFERTMIAANNMAISISGGIPTFEQLRSTAIQLGKALQDPAGQLGALSRSGFTFTGSQKEMIKNLVAQNKLQEAQNIILDAADTQFGKLNEQMRDTAQGAFAAMINEASDLAEKLGAELAPNSKAFAERMTELFEGLQENVKQITLLALVVRDTTIAFVGSKIAIRAVRAAIAAYNAGLSRTIVLQSMATFGLTTIAAMSASYHMRQRLLNMEIEKGENLYEGYGQKVQEAEIDLTKATEALEKQTMSLKIQQEMAIANINIENAALLGLTSEELKRFEQKKRNLMITEELLKIDKVKRDGMRDEIIKFVDLKISYQGYLEKVKDHVKELKELQKANDLVKKAEEAITKAQRESIINTEKLVILNSDLSKEEKQAALQRIDNIAELDARIESVFGEGQNLQALFDSGMGIKEMGNVMFQTDSQFDSFVQHMIEAITTGKDLDQAMKEFNETLKETAEADPMKQFTENAQIALQAFQGFTTSYGTLVDERMNRELEALKTTRAFEEATTEEREVMQNRIEQRFRNQRRRAFQMNKASSIANATMNTLEGVTKALASKQLGLATLIRILGFAQVAAIAAQPAPRFATGGSFITSGPRNIMVGESGAEKVTIQPLSGGTPDGSTRTQNVNISISAPLVDETILDVIIPKIKEAAELNLA